MTDHNDPNPSAAPSGEGAAFDRRDELISRVIDGEASERDWTALRALAQHDPTVWTDLTATQRQHELLTDAVEEIGMLAEGVDIPEGELLTPGERFQRRMDGVRAWGGWAAAAAILLVWFTGMPAPMGSDSGVQTGSVIPLNQGTIEPSKAFEQYLESGRQAGTVLGVMPQRTVLETRPSADGSGTEVLYVRQIIEREFVPADQMFKVSRDEFGTASIQPAPPPDPRTRTSY
jgi:hypothetical protein